MKNIAIIFTTLFIILSSLQIYSVFAVYQYHEQHIIDVKDQKRAELKKSGLSDEEIAEDVDSWESFYREWENVRKPKAFYIIKSLFLDLLILSFLLAVASYYFFIEKRFRLKIVSLIILIFLMDALQVLVRRTYLFMDSQGFAIFNSFDADQLSFNPYDQDGYLMTPDIAYWLFMNTPTNLESCRLLKDKSGECTGTLLHILVTQSNLNNPSQEKKERTYNMLKKAIKSGADVNEPMPDSKLPLIFIPVLDNDPELLSYLLSAGADPHQKINDPGDPDHGQDILSYLDTRSYLRNEDYTEIKKILRAALSEDSRAQP